MKKIKEKDGQMVLVGLIIFCIGAYFTYKGYIKATKIDNSDIEGILKVNSLLIELAKQSYLMIAGAFLMLKGNRLI